MRQRARKRFALLGLATVLALLVTACAGGGDDEQTASDGIITINWSSEPPSLDPGLATDTTSSNILFNIMDPLLKLEGEDLTPTPALAESWTVDGKTVTFKLRRGRQVDERRSGHRAGLRVLLEAHDLTGTGRRLRVSVLGNRGR